MKTMNKKHGSCTACKKKHGRHDCDDHKIDCGDCVPVYDFIVVGAGTGGAPLARKLSDAGFEVLIVEGGRDTRRDPLVQSANPFPQFADPSYHYYYPSDISPIAPNPPLISTLYPEGRQWGGSSAHNFVTWIRGTPCLYDQWACLSGDDRWSWDEVLPILKGIETYTPLITGVFNPRTRGRCGPVSVTQTGTPFTSVVINPNDPIIQAFGAEGSPYTADQNDPERGLFTTGDGQAILDPTTFTRDSSAEAFLGTDVIRTDANGDGHRFDCGGVLDIFSNALTVRVIFDDEVDVDLWSEVVTGTDHDLERAFREREDQVHDGRLLVSVESRIALEDDASTSARGVEFIKNGVVQHAVARRKVILSAGAVQSPAILIRSGIGPRDALQRIGVCPRLINENVGRRFQEHYGPVVVLPIPDPTVPKGYWNSFFPGPESECDGCRDFQAIALLNDPDFGFGGVLGLLTLLLRPEPAGEIIVDSATDPLAVRIDFDFYDSPRDRETALRIVKTFARISIRLTGQLPLLPPAAVYPAAEFGPFGGLAPNDDQLLAVATQASNFAFHISGTAKMGKSICDAVVDSELDVFGIDNLAIADNSITPQISDSNTQTSAYVAGLVKAEIEGAQIDRDNDACCVEHSGCHDHGGGHGEDGRDHDHGSRHAADRHGDGHHGGGHDKGHCHRCGGSKRRAA